MTIKINFNHPKNVFNKQIFDNLTDYTNFTEVYYGGASSGKSHGVVQKVVFKTLQDWKYPRKVLFMRKTATSIKESIFADVLDCLSTWGILSNCNVNNTDKRITLPNGAVFLFKGMDDSEKIKSIKGISDVVLEEATEFLLDDYTQLTLRLREKKHKNKQIFLMFNPVSKVNWVYKYFFNKKRENTKIIHSTYKDNHFLDETTKQNIEVLAKNNESYYKIYALGEFATLDKLIFPKYDKKLLNKDVMRKIPSYFGLDFGFTNDPSAFMHVKVDDTTKTIYIMEEYVQQGMLNNEIANVIKSLGYAKEQIKADAAEPKSISELRRDGIARIKPAKKGPDSIIQGIQFLQQYKLVVDTRCVKTIEELDNYTWKKDKQTNEYVNTPVDTFNHTIDAIRYAVQDIHSKAKFQSFKGGI